MADIQSPQNDDASQLEARRALARADRECPFGPSFFLGQLGRFVRDHCPDPSEQLPVVEIHLIDGGTLDLCHIIGVSSQWVMLAVHDGAGGDEMSIELVPFGFVRGVSIRSRHAKGESAGFIQVKPPEVMAAEALLEAGMPPMGSAA